MRKFWIGGLSLAAAAGALAVSAGVTSAAESIGAEYGAREPARCANRAEPAQGAPSAAQVAQLIKCSIEGIGDGRLYLIDDVKIASVGQGRPFDAQNDYFEDIDRTKPIYPITGSLIRWECENPNPQNTGKSCSQFLEANARGACYTMTGGNWYCSMSDLFHKKTEGLPPPKS
jgi:hypothetical protein